MHQMLVGLTGPLSLLETSFKDGGGVPPSAFEDAVWDGMERFSSNWSQQLFVQACLPAMPGIQAKLEQGARVLEVGCGRGGALIRLAAVFPRSIFVGYDNFPPAVDRARANAQAAGLAERVTFERADAADGLPAGQDIVLAFDVLHEAASPRRLLAAVHDSLRPNGRFVCLEMNCSENLEDNLGPRGAFLYGVSLLHCMTTSLAAGGEGLGALGLPEVTLRRLCTEAGFGELREVMRTPFVSLYEAPH